MIYTSIIPDAQYQSLNMSFTFDDQHQDRLVINAHIQNSIYQSEFTHHLSFPQVKQLLETKIFKLVEQTPKTLKLKVGNRIVDFSNGVKLVDSHVLQEQISQHLEKMLKRQEESLLSKEITTQLRKDIDLMATKITDLSMKQNQTEQQNRLLKQQLSKAPTQIAQIQKQLRSQKDLLNFQKLQITQLKKNINSQNTQINCSKFQTKTQIQLLKDEIQLLKNSSLSFQINPQNRNQFAQNISNAQDKNLDKNKIKQINKKLKSQIQLTWDSEQNKLTNVWQAKKITQTLQDIQVLQQNFAYKFSQKYKNPLISLSKNNTQAECSIFAGFALVNGMVNRKGSSIKFKIQKLTSGLDVGLAIKSIIAENSFELKNAKKIGHGGFLLENNGLSFSHSIEHNNNNATGYGFGEGDVIEVITNDSQLAFRNKTKGWEYRMNVLLTEKQWSEACFCVYLTKGNSVQIII